MRKIILIVIFSIAVFTISNTVNAQIQKGNIMVGGSIADLSLGFNDGSNTTFTLNPKVGWFIQNRIALGADLLFGVAHTKGIEGSLINYGVGAFGRYYISDPTIEVIRRSRFFIEANAGIQGENRTKGGSSTNGFGYGIGPGFAYFITSNIGLEALVKYNGIVGFGSKPYKSNLIVGVGFQIYLSGKAAKNRIESDFSK